MGGKAAWTGLSYEPEISLTGCKPVSIAMDRNTTLSISRADVADFMLKQLNQDTYFHQTPGLSY